MTSNGGASLSLAVLPFLFSFACGARSSLEAGRTTTAGAGGSATTSSTSAASSSSGTAPPPGFVSVACGGGHVCAVTTAGAVVCWGYGGSGQLGGGKASGFSSSLVAVVGVAGATRVTAGGEHTCALAQGTVHCWGSDSYGQLGDGASGLAVTRPTPVTVALPAPATAISAGGFHYGGGHTCALLDSGQVWCWGANTGGQIGGGEVGFGALSATPVPVTGLAGAAVTIAAGGAHTCASLADGTAACWGYDDHGQIGNGSSGDGLMVTSPTAVVGLPSQVTAVAAGEYQSCARVAGGEVFCWGVGAFGQFGIGPSTPSNPIPKPTLAFLGASCLDLDQGATHGCVVHEAGDVACAGMNDLGEVGGGMPGAFAFALSPVPVGVQDAVAISAGATTTCALRKGGALSCWGDWMGPTPVDVAPP